MAKSEWGLKRTCLSCGARFYDMKKDPIVCPSCETVFDPDAVLRPRRSRAPVESSAPKPAPAAAAEESDDDLDLGDDDDVVDLDDDEDDDALEDTSDLGEDDDDVTGVSKNIGSDDD